MLERLKDEYPTIDINDNTFANGVKYATIIANAVLSMILYDDPDRNVGFLICDFHDIMKNIDNPRLPVIEEIEKIKREHRYFIDLEDLKFYVPELRGYDK